MQDGIRIVYSYAYLTDIANNHASAGLGLKNDLSRIINIGIRFYESISYPRQCVTRGIDSS